MTEDGYTLAEALAAMLILGLSVGGMVKGADAIGQFERRTATAAASTVKSKALDTQLKRLLSEAGPFLSDGEGGFVGGANALSFPCASTCRADLVSEGAGAKLKIKVLGRDQTLELGAVARGSRPLRFQYESNTGSFDRWPPLDNADPGQIPAALRKVSLIGGSGETLADVRLWPEQSRDCAFDSIARLCRKAAP